MARTNEPKLGWGIFQHDSDLRFSTTSGRSGRNDFAQQPTEENIGYEEKIVNLFQTSNEKSKASVSEETPNSQGFYENDLPVSSNANGNRTPRNEVTEPEPELFNEILRSIFTIGKVSCDVVLENNCIKWSPVGISKVKRPSSSRRSKKSVIEKGIIFLHELYAVKLKSMKNVKTSTTSTLGFSIFFAEQNNHNKLKENTIFFECFSRDLCIKWGKSIKTYIDAFKNRPKNVLLLSSNSKTASEVWQDIVSPRFITAGVECDFTMMMNPGYALSYIQQALTTYKENEKQIDAVLCLGKLNLFSEVINGIMQLFTNKRQVEFTLPLFGYLPISEACKVGSVMFGCSDAETAVMHCIYGCSRAVSLCEFDHPNPALKYGLTASYGFSGGDTIRTPGSSKKIRLPSASLDKSYAITKALVQRKAYSCDVMYKNVDSFEVANPVILNGFNDGFHDNQLNMDDWLSLPRKNYLDITITSLSGYFTPNDISRNFQQVYARLLPENVSRKELVRNSQSSLRSIRESVTTEPINQKQDECDVVEADEIVIQPTSGINQTTSSTDHLHTNSGLSRWAIDDNVLDIRVQSIHANIAKQKLQMYSSCFGQTISRPLTQDEAREMKNLLSQVQESSA